MDVRIKARDFKVDEGLRGFIEARVAKLDRFIGRGAEAKMEIVHEHPRNGGERFTAQLTIAARQILLRAEEQHTDARRAVDMAVDTMLGQIRRYHSKRIDRSRRPSIAEFVTLPELDAADLAELRATETFDAPDNVATGDDDADLAIVRRKRFALKPMTSDEAIDQLELLGHTFFVFFNADEESINVLYRRRNGAYGLIQPE
jgi:putative sigma-54 modulation protein